MKGCTLLAFVTYVLTTLSCTQFAFAKGRKFRLSLGQAFGLPSPENSFFGQKTKKILSRICTAKICISSHDEFIIRLAR